MSAHNMPGDTDDVPLDGDRDLDARERQVLRKMIRDQERMRWLWRVSRVGVALLAGLATAILWTMDHVKLTK
ncbi:MAG TPA: hypothetical protein PLN11_00135 [Ottowia sp.]|nr:hypothetical protein [Ottowia sp.]